MQRLFLLLLLCLPLGFFACEDDGASISQINCERAEAEVQTSVADLNTDDFLDYFVGSWKVVAFEPCPILCGTDNPVCQDVDPLIADRYRIFPDSTMEIIFANGNPNLLDTFQFGFNSQVWGVAIDTTAGLFINSFTENFGYQFNPEGGFIIFEKE